LLIYLSDVNDERGRQLGRDLATSSSSDLKSGRYRGRVAG